MTACDHAHPHPALWARPVRAENPVHHPDQQNCSPDIRPQRSTVTCLRLLSQEWIQRWPVLGGLINEYERAAYKPRSGQMAEFWNPTGIATTPAHHGARGAATEHGLARRAARDRGRRICLCQFCCLGHQFSARGPGAHGNS
jgi:hypothetical protein